MYKRKVSRVQSDLVEIIEKVAEIKNLKNIQYSVDLGVDDVDSFASGLHKVNISGLRNGIKIKMQFIIKWHYKPEDRACFREAYKREILIYSHVEPIFIKIQRNRIPIAGLKYKFPNCVYTSMEHNKETIVLHATIGYKVFNRFAKMDFTHVSLVMKNLAKLHALSFIADKLYPEKFKHIKEVLSKDVQYSNIAKIPPSLLWYFNISVSVISDLKIKEKLTRISSKIFHILNKYSAPISEYNAICHADCWTNNILFKYMGGKAVDAAFVDYQLARYASPITDISYFLYLSTDYDFLSNHYDRLLNIYYGTMSAILRQCDMDVEETFPRHIFQDHLREYSIIGLVEALIAMKIITADSEEAQKMMEVRNQQSNGWSDYETDNQFFIRRVNGIVKFFFEKIYDLDGLPC